MRKRLELAGQRFGLLVALHRDPESPRHWIVLCDCGTRKSVLAGNLLGQKSCGCAKAKHGHARSGRVTSEYMVWRTMRRRCEDPNNRDWARYGGRGISVCERWRESFEAFLEDMGPKPSPRHSVDRINNDGNYEPGNCRWATAREQAGNTSRAKLIEFRGKSQCVAEWAREMGMSRGRLHDRLKWGWDFERALMTPVKTRKDGELC